MRRICFRLAWEMNRQDEASTSSGNSSEEPTSRSDVPAAGGTAHAVVEPHSPRSLKMADYDLRRESFTHANWRMFFKGIGLVAPENMASYGWYCTGKRCVKCYACFKVPARKINVFKMRPVCVKHRWSGKCPGA